MTRDHKALWRSPTDIVSDFVRYYPVNLEGLAAALGIYIVEDPFLDDSISGKIEKLPDHPIAYKITLNGKHHRNRKRFTLAHEIAHYVLHRDLIGDGITDNAMYRSVLGDSFERQANRYAANLLMPASLVLGLWNEGHRSPEDLARLLDVSKAAATIRLKEVLGPKALDQAAP